MNTSAKAGENIVGRNPLRCTICINDPRVSNRHARIVVDGQSATIDDLDSTNHTFVGDLHITISNGATSVIMADGVGLSNNLNGAGNQAVPVDVLLKTGPQLQLVGAATQKIALAPAHEGVVTFRVRATQTLGSGMLAFTASYGGKSASQRIDLSVRPASAYRTQIDIARVAPVGEKTISPLRKCLRTTAFLFKSRNVPETFSK